MNTLMFFLIPAIAVVLLFTPLIPVYRGLVTGTKAKKRLVINLCMFGGMCLVAFILPTGGFIEAMAETTQAANPITGTIAQGLGFLSATIAVGLGSLAAGYAVASAASAAIGACTEDSHIFGKALIFVALGEGVAIYGLLIAILIMNKL